MSKKLLKNDIIELLVNNTQVLDVTIKNTYGQPFSIVFDIWLSVEVNGVYEIFDLHANNHSHALRGHQRPNLYGNDYKGTQPRSYYIEEVKRSWFYYTTRTLKEYYNRFKKAELLSMLLKYELED